MVLIFEVSNALWLPWEIDCRPILLELGVPLKICGDVHGQCDSGRAQHSMYCRRTTWAHMQDVQDVYNFWSPSGTLRIFHVFLSEFEWVPTQRDCRRDEVSIRYSDLLKLFECGGFPPEDAERESHRMVLNISFWHLQACHRQSRWWRHTKTFYLGRGVIFQSRINIPYISLNQWDVMILPHFEIGVCLKGPFWRDLFETNHFHHSERPGQLPLLGRLCGSG